MQAVTSPGWSYTEYARLPGSLGDDAAGLNEAAKHFESLFINMWLKSAREANAALAKDSFFSSNEMELQQQMFDSQMAMHLAKEGGIGLAPTIVQQLKGGEAVNPADAGQEPMRIDDWSIARLTRTRPSGTRTSKFDDAKEFVADLAPRIKDMAGSAGLPALTVMAQAVLETGWGTAVIENAQGESSHNLFGLKDTNWQGPSVMIHSKEYMLGGWQDKIAGFRAYPDWDTGIADYVASITESSRYGDGQDLDAWGFAELLQQSGYATDPEYAQKLKGIMHRLPGLGF